MPQAMILDGDETCEIAIKSHAFPACTELVAFFLHPGPGVLGCDDTVMSGRRACPLTFGPTGPSAGIITTSPNHHIFPDFGPWTLDLGPTAHLRSSAANTRFPQSFFCFPAFLRNPSALLRVLYDLSGELPAYFRGLGRVCAHKVTTSGGVKCARSEEFYLPLKEGLTRDSLTSGGRLCAQMRPIAQV